MFDNYHYKLNYPFNFNLINTIKINQIEIKI
jgi:hypothetical protein